MSRFNPFILLAFAFAFVLVFVFAFSLTAPELAEARRRKKTVGILDTVTREIDETLVAPPKDNEVCFSPDEQCDIKLVKFIDSAQSSIDVAVFDVTLDQVAHHLLLQARKIPVRVVVDSRQSKGEHSLVKTLIKGGAEVRIGRQRGVMHHKFVIIDGKRLQTGSFNYTNNAATANQENQLYLSTPAVVQRYVERFEAIWDESKPARR